MHAVSTFSDCRFSRCSLQTTSPREPTEKRHTAPKRAEKPYEYFAAICMGYGAPECGNGVHLKSTIKPHAGWSWYQNRSITMPAAQTSIMAESQASMSNGSTPSLLARLQLFSPRLTILVVALTVSFFNFGFDQSNFSGLQTFPTFLERVSSSTYL